MKKRGSPIELYYWPGIPGRGEFVRLLLEDASAAYVDVARDRENGLMAMMRLLDGQEKGALPLFQLRDVPLDLPDVLAFALQPVDFDPQVSH